MARPFHNRKRRGQRHKTGNRQLRTQACEGYAKWTASISGEISPPDDSGGTLTLVAGPFDPGQLRSHYGYGYEYPTLNRAERRFVVRQAGCTIYVHPQDGVSVEWFEQEIDNDLVTRDYATFRRHGRKYRETNVIAFTVPEGENWTEHFQRYADEQTAYVDVWHLGENGDWHRATPPRVNA